MKTLLLLSSLLVSTYSFAEGADYVCGVQQYRVDIDLHQDRTTSMWMTDTVNQETITQGYAGWVENKGSKTTYHFYPASLDEVQITFNTQDTVDLPDRLTGYIKTSARGMLVWDTLMCRLSP